VDAVHFEWDPTVSDDPDSPHFSLSIGGRGFYVVGLHPGASRAARRFPVAALVFNLHSQFEALRADGRYGRLRDVITQRDVAYSGSRNPMLAIHGEQSEARQYSGRKVEADWRCPFSSDTGCSDAA
jgi:FPC/CPF motif-containing protein YcgG